MLVNFFAKIIYYFFYVFFHFIWDVDAMADAIYGLVQYPALSKFATEQGFDEVNKLKWNNATAKMKTVYESVVNKI